MRWLLLDDFSQIYNQWEQKSEVENMQCWEKRVKMLKVVGQVNAEKAAINW